MTSRTLMLRRALRAIVLVVLSSSCAPAPSLDATLRLASPLSLGVDVAFARLTVRQADRVQELTIGPDVDEVAVSVRAGEEVTLEVQLFSLDIAAWRAFDAAHSLTPVVGDNSLTLTLGAAPSVSGSVVGVFDVDGVAKAAQGLRLPVTITDEATGFVAEAAFETLATYSMPFGRRVTLSVHDPVSDTDAFVALDTSDYAQGVSVFLGALPPIKPPTTVRSAGELAGGVAAPFALECALGAACEEDAVWLPCADSSLDLPTERAYQVAVRYREVPAACVVATVARDTTPPRVSLRTEPPFVAPGALDVTLHVSGNEPLDPLALTVRWSNGPNPTSQRCRSVAENAGALACALDLAGWTSGAVDLSISGADLQGNAFVATTRVGAVTAQTGLILAGVRTRGAPLDPSASFYVGFDVVNFETTRSCFVRTAQLAFSPPSGTSLASVTLNDDEVLGRQGPQPRVRTLWGRVNRGQISGTLDVGTYAFAGTLSVRDCGTGAPLPDLTSSATVTFAEPPVRWLTSGPLVVHPFGGSSGAGRLTPAPAEGYPTDAISSDSSTVWVTADGAPMLEAVKPGLARLTLLDGTKTVDIDVRVPQVPTVVALQAQRVVYRSATTDLVRPLGRDLGAPVALLWESTLDAVAAVGASGAEVQLPDGSAVSVDEPCGIELDSPVAQGGEPVPAGDIVGAAWARGVARTAPGLALLVRDAAGAFHHCEVEVATSDVVLNAPWPVSTQCPMPAPTWTGSVRFASDAVSGRFVIVASDDTGGCVLTYASDGGALGQVEDVASSAYAGYLNRVSLDARSAYLAVTVDGSTGPVLGGFWVGRSPFAASPYDGSFMAAPVGFVDVAVDSYSGQPLALGNAYYTSDTGVFQSFANRYDGTQAYLVSHSRPSTAWDRLVIDPSNRRVYASRWSGVGYQMLTISTSELEQQSWGASSPDLPVRQWPDAQSVSFLTLAGPEPHGVTPMRLTPGGVATISGVGFAGAGLDEVYVYGLRAEVLDSTSTAVEFIVPPVLDGVLLAGVSQLPVVVVSRDRISGSISVPLDAWGALPAAPRTPGAMLGPVIGPEGTCPTGCGGACTGAASPVDFGYASTLYFVRAQTGLNGTVLKTDGQAADCGMAASQTLGFVRPVSVPGRPRVVGYSGGTWFDHRFNLDWDAQAQSLSELRRSPMTMPVQADGPVAAAPSGDLLAVGAGDAAYLFWANTLAPHPYGKLQAGRISGAPGAPVSTTGSVTKASFIHFNAHDDVIVASSSGEVAGYRLRPVPAALEVERADAACAASGTRSVLALGPSLSGGATMVELYDQAGVRQVVVKEIASEGGGLVVHCRSSGALDATAAPHAVALSGTGRYLAMAVPVGATERLRLYDTADVRHPTSSTDLSFGAPHAMIFQAATGRLVLAAGNSAYYVEVWEP